MVACSLIDCYPNVPPIIWKQIDEIFFFLPFSQPKQSLKVRREEFFQHCQTVQPIVTFYCETSICYNNIVSARLALCFHSNSSVAVTLVILVHLKCLVATFSGDQTLSLRFQQPEVRFSLLWSHLCVLQSYSIDNTIDLWATATHRLKVLQTYSYKYPTSKSHLLTVKISPWFHSHPDCKGSVPPGREAWTLWQLKTAACGWRDFCRIACFQFMKCFKAITV